MMARVPSASFTALLAAVLLSTAGRAQFCANPQCDTFRSDDQTIPLEETRHAVVDLYDPNVAYTACEISISGAHPLDEVSISELFSASEEDGDTFDKKVPFDAPKPGECSKLCVNFSEPIWGVSMRVGCNLAGDGPKCNLAYNVRCIPAVVGFFASVPWSVRIGLLLIFCCIIAACCFIGYLRYKSWSEIPNRAEPADMLLLHKGSQPSGLKLRAPSAAYEEDIDDDDNKWRIPEVRDQRIQSTVQSMYVQEANVTGGQALPDGPDFDENNHFLIPGGDTSRLINTNNMATGRTGTFDVSDGESWPMVGPAHGEGHPAQDDLVL